MDLVGVTVPSDSIFLLVQATAWAAQLGASLAVHDGLAMERWFRVGVLGHDTGSEVQML